MSAPSPRLNLEQRRKQAKDLRRAHAAGDRDAARRIATHLPRLADRPAAEILQAEFSLQEAQHVIAREGGFRNWRELHAQAKKAGEAETLVDDWRAHFDEIYRLEAGQAVKRVPPPFIPARTDYFESEQLGWTRPPDSLFFHWGEDGLTWFGGGSLGEEGFSLVRILRHILCVPTFEYDGPEHLLTTLKMPGDWIVRAATPMVQQLEALAHISELEIGWPFEAERVAVEREVIIVSGKFELTQVRGASENEVIFYLYDEELEHLEEDGGGGSAGLDTIEEFVELLGNRVGMPVENRVTNEFRVSHPCHHLSSTGLFDKPAEERSRKLPLLLANVTAQTGLQFELGTQTVEIWQLHDGRERQARSTRGA